MPEKGFDLGNYVEVKDRLGILYELFPQARVTTTYDLTAEPDEKPKVICRALVYRTPEDPVPATGTSWMYLPGTTSYTRGSEIENCETSAVGRAIGLMGILIDRSIATSNEIESKKDDGSKPRPAPAHLPPRDGSLIGLAEVAKAPHDYELRLEAPENPDEDATYSIGFKLTEGKGQVRVIAFGPLAEALSLVKDDVIGQRVTCFGKMSNETWDFGKGAEKKAVPYTRLVLSRIETPTIVLPTIEPEADPGWPPQDS